MSVITRVPEPNLWEVILKGFNEKRPPFKEDDDASSIHTTLENYDPAIHNPVFYGKMHEKIYVPETDTSADVDPATVHPATIGHALVDRPTKSPPPPPAPLPDIKTCSPRDYLEAYIFPVLLPALEEMLKQAKVEKCFERKRTKFNGCDFLTEYLYNHNTGCTDRENVQLGDIPFVAEHWKLHPRPPLPMSLLWTEEEATLIVQSHFRGFKVRCDSEIQDLRRWQREWREENSNIKTKVDDFWAKQMPDDDETLNASDEMTKIDGEGEESKEEAAGDVEQSNQEEEDEESLVTSPELFDGNDDCEVTTETERDSYLGMANQVDDDSDSDDD